MLCGNAGCTVTVLASRAPSFDASSGMLLEAGIPLCWDIEPAWPSRWPSCCCCPSVAELAMSSSREVAASSLWMRVVSGFSVVTGMGLLALKRSVSPDMLQKEGVGGVRGVPLDQSGQVVHAASSTLNPAHRDPSR